MVKILLKTIVLKFLYHSGYIGRKARSKKGELRILCYHGVCRDKDRSIPWLPAYYVTESQLSSHIEFLKNIGTIIHLPEVLVQLKEGKLAKGIYYAITFDDGAANNLTIGLPILKRHNVKACFFCRYWTFGKWFHVSQRCY